MGTVSPLFRPIFAGFNPSQLRFHLIFLITAHFAVLLTAYFPPKKMRVMEVDSSNGHKKMGEHDDNFFGVFFAVAHFLNNSM